MNKREVKIRLRKLNIDETQNVFKRVYFDYKLELELLSTILDFLIVNTGTKYDEDLKNRISVLIDNVFGTYKHSYWTDYKIEFLKSNDRHIKLFCYTDNYTYIGLHICEQTKKGMAINLKNSSYIHSCIKDKIEETYKSVVHLEKFINKNGKLKKPFVKFINEININIENITPLLDMFSIRHGVDLHNDIIDAILPGYLINDEQNNYTTI